MWYLIWTSWCLSVVRVHYFSLCYNKDNRQSHLRDKCHCMAAGTRGGCCQKTGRERQPPSCFLLFFPSKPQPVSSVAHIQGSSSSVSPFSEQPYGRHQGRISMLILNPAKLTWRWTVTAPPLVNLTSKLYKVIEFHLAPRVSFSCRGTDPAL